MERNFSHVFQAGSCAGVEKWIVQDNSKAESRGRLGDVCGNLKLSSDIKHIRAEEIKDHSTDGRKSAEKGKKVGVLQTWGLEHEVDKGGMRGERNRREDVKIDRRVGRRDTGNWVCDGVVDHDHGDRETLPNEELGEFYHGNKVANTQARVKHHHFFLHCWGYEVLAV